MKKTGLRCIILCLLLSFLLPTINADAADTEQEKDKSFGCYSLDAESTRLGNTLDVTNMQSAILYETNSDSLMFTHNADEPTDPASFVKIMTGYVAAEKGNMADKIVITETAMNAISSAAIVLDLQVGEVLTLEDLMHCMLVRSSNEAAVIIAEHISGSQQAFVEEMNRMAQALGCENTHFVNATGLYDENQFSTARDIAKILEAALEYDAFRKPFCASDYTVPATNMSDERLLVTTNYLIYGNYDGVAYYVDKRVTGGRVGVSNIGKRMVAAVSEYGTMEMISIVMGSDSEWSKDGTYISRFGGYLETSAMLNAGYANLKVSQILFENQALTQLPVENGECDVVIGPKEAAYALIGFDATLARLTYRYSHTGKDFEAPISKGDYLSTVEVWSDGVCVAMTDLYAMNDVDVLLKAQEPSQNAGNKSENIGQIILTVLAAIAVLVLVVAIWRRVRKLLMKKRRQRYRESHKRSR